VLTTARPWDGFDEAARLAALRAGRSLDLALLPLSTPPAVRALVARCLAFERAQRPSMREVRATLERELEALRSGSWDVFLSYAWGRDAARVPLVDALYVALREAGLRVWLDRNEMGRDLRADMVAGIAHSAVFVVLASPDYASSANCLFELRAASVAGRPIVAACAEPRFWRLWMLADGMTRAVPNDHELARLAGLAAFLFADLGEAARVDWLQAPVPADERRRLTHAPEALPRLLRLIKDAQAQAKMAPAQTR